MNAESQSSGPDGEYAALEELCRKVGQNIANSRSVREAVEVAEVEVPHHLRASAYSRVPTLSRLPRMRDQRVEEIVKKQLTSISLERNDLVATREFDRIKAVDWHVLRVNYPELYSRAIREANLILERKRRR